MTEPNAQVMAAFEEILFWKGGTEKLQIATDELIHELALAIFGKPLDKEKPLNSFRAKLMNAKGFCPIQQHSNFLIKKRNNLLDPGPIAQATALLFEDWLEEENSTSFDQIEEQIEEYSYHFTFEEFKDWLEHDQKAISTIELKRLFALYLTSEIPRFNRLKHQPLVQNNAYSDDAIESEIRKHPGQEKWRLAVTRLHLQSPLNPNELEQLLLTFPHITDLTVPLIDTEGNIYSFESIKRILEALCFRLKSFTVFDSPLNNKQLKLIVSYLKPCQKLESIGFKVCKISKESLGHLLPLFKKKTISIDLAHNSIGNDGLKMLLQHFEKKKSENKLNSLSLRGNPISSFRTKRLQKLPSLIEFDLSDTNIKMKQWRNILSCWPIRNTTLFASGTKFTAFYFHNFTFPKQIVHFYFDECQLNDAAVTKLLKILPSNTKTLDLSHNPITDSIAQAIADFAKPKVSLLLDYTELTGNGLQIINAK